MPGPPIPPSPAPGSNAIGSFIIGVSPIGTIPSFDMWQTIISQYADSSKITQLISNWFQYIDQTADIDAFLDNIWDITTAVGYGLDVWGRIVGVTRILTVQTGRFFGFEEQGITVDPFNQSPFYAGVPSSANFSLSDSAFRSLIYAKALFNITNGSIPAINQILRTLFPNRGNAFVTEPKVATNLLLQSNTFNSSPTWFTTLMTMSSGASVSPDGTNDAWLFQRTAATLAFIQQLIVKDILAQETFTFSVYAKPGTGRYLCLFANDNVGNGQTESVFDLLAGTIIVGAATAGNFSNVSSTITQVDNGWFRCTLTFTSNAFPHIGVFMSWSQASIDIFGTDTISNATMYFFGAQVEQSTFAGQYVPTTTVPASGRDAQNMTMTYMFKFHLTPVETAIVSNSGVLPKPAGVSATVVQL